MQLHCQETAEELVESWRPRPAVEVARAAVSHAMQERMPESERLQFISIHIYVCIYVHVCMCIYIYMNVYMCIYIFTYIHKAEPSPITARITGI